MGSLGDAAFHWLKSPVAKFEDQRGLTVIVDVNTDVIVVVVVAVTVVVAVSVVVQVVVAVAVVIAVSVDVVKPGEVTVTVVAELLPMTKALPRKARTTNAEMPRAANTLGRLNK